MKWKTTSTVQYYPTYYGNRSVDWYVPVLLMLVCVSVCVLQELCQCRPTDGNCSCCKECMLCLGNLWEECCDCVGECSVLQLTAELSQHIIQDFHRFAHALRREWSWETSVKQISASKRYSWRVDLSGLFRTVGTLNIRHNLNWNRSGTEFGFRFSFLSSSYMLDLIVRVGYWAQYILRYSPNYVGTTEYRYRS